MSNHHPRRICCAEFDDTGLVPFRHHLREHSNNNKVNFYFMLTGIVIGFAFACLFLYTCQLQNEIENLKMKTIQINQDFDHLKRPTEEDFCLQSREDIINSESSVREIVPEIVPETDPVPRINPSKTKDSDPENSEIVNRREFIREMMRNAWNAYTCSAWGYEALKPVTNETSGLYGSGRSIVASMSTLWAMELKVEFEQARKWIKRELHFGKLNQKLNVFSVVTGYIGGLLSCFALTGDRMFVDKADEIAQAIRPAYGATKTGLPVGTINPVDKNTYSKYYELSLSQIAQQLEYRYLADITSDPHFAQPIQKIWKFIRGVDKPRGLYMYWLDLESGSWTTNLSTLLGHSSEFYFNLLKSYIQTSGTNQEVIQWYRDAIDAVKANGMFAIRSFSPVTTSDSDSPNSATPILYAREYDYLKKSNDEAYDTRLGFSSCQLGAMLSLGSSVMMINDGINWMDIAQNVTDGCQVLSDSTKTGLMPAVYDFDNRQHGHEYSLSPQLAQSYFILWRLTHNQIYRDNAWKMVQAIHRHCRTESGGYSSIENVNQVPTVKTNYQPPHFLSATLKYLYLTFTPDSVLPLDQWVFNSAGHPLPICGTSDSYPAETCN